MAIEAPHLNLFSPQLITNRDLDNSKEMNVGIFNTQMGSGVPFAGKLPEAILPFPQYLTYDSFPVKPSTKADSGVTYNVPAATRKRSRDSLNQIITFTAPPENNQPSDLFSLSFLGEEIPLQIHRQHMEIDHIVAEYTKKIRLEVEERQKEQARLLVSAIGERMAKKMKEKDDQIQRMVKLNWVLQERVKTLFAENQIWRDLAQTNEATANSLRTNLEQVLAHVTDERLAGGGRVTAPEDAESCCDSSDHGREGAEEDEEVERRMLAAAGTAAAGGGRKQMCKRCGERESSVLLLPCRHLCLCALCGSSASLHRTCPVCNSIMNASLHVNMS